MSLIDQRFPKEALNKQPLVQWLDKLTTNEAIYELSPVQKNRLA